MKTKLSEVNWELTHKLVSNVQATAIPRIFPLVTEKVAHTNGN